MLLAVKKEARNNKLRGDRSETTYATCFVFNFKRTEKERQKRKYMTNKRPRRPWWWVVDSDYCHLLHSRVIRGALIKGKQTQNNVVVTKNFSSSELRWMAYSSRCTHCCELQKKNAKTPHANIIAGISLVHAPCISGSHLTNKHGQIFQDATQHNTHIAGRFFKAFTTLGNEWWIPFFFA